MKIDNISFNLYVPRIDNLRGKSQEIERELSNYFAPFNILSIPESAPEEIPRIIAKSYSGHSELIISAINLQLNINFDENYNFDLEKCFDYTYARAMGIVDCISKYVNNNFIFSGVSARFSLDDITEPINFLEEKFINIKSKHQPYNMSQKIAYILDEKYYFNINIFNLRSFEGIIEQGKVKPKIEEVSNVIAIEFDMNDKYGYNHNDEHLCKKETIHYILSTIKESINKNVEKIVEGDELDI